MHYEPTNYTPPLEPTRAAYSNPYDLSNPFAPPPPSSRKWRRLSRVLALLFALLLLLIGTGFSGYFLGIQSVDTTVPYHQGYAQGQIEQAAQDVNMINATATAAYDQGYNDGIQATSSKITASYNQGYTSGENAEYTTILNWLQASGECTRDSYGYYPYIFISNGQLYCR